jgi:hypothetical protein
VLPTPGKCYRPENPKILPLAEKFGHSHYFSIETDFIVIYQNSCRTKVRKMLNKYVD